jgi:hypothetical protein
MHIMHRVGATNLQHLQDKAGSLTRYLTTPCQQAEIADHVLAACNSCRHIRHQNLELGVRSGHLGAAPVLLAC